MTRAGALVVVAALVACTGGGSSEPGPTSSSGQSGSSTSSSGTPFTVEGQVIVTASLSGDSCPNKDATFSIGAFGNPNAQPAMPSEPVKNNESWQGKTIRVTCSAKPADNQFALEATIADGDANSMSINARADTQSGAAESFITEVKIGSAVHKSKSCTVTYPTAGGVAAGRFWAQISCTAEASETCGIEAEVRLENCAQQ